MLCSADKDFIIFKKKKEKKKKPAKKHPHQITYILNILLDTYT